MEEMFSNNNESQETGENENLLDFSLKTSFMEKDKTVIVFDFGGGGEPGVPYGVRDYKLKYGCDIHDFGRFLCIHNSFVYRIGKTAISLLGMKK